MKSIYFRQSKDEVAIHTQDRLLDALLMNEVEVMMLCGGRGLCATCHVYVTRNPHCLTPVTEREKKTLSLLTTAQPNSRLACQAHVVGEDIEVALPDGLYVESFSDIESLVGKRTKVPILHPVDGRTLIHANKIITRSAIMELKDVDFNPTDIELD